PRGDRQPHVHVPAIDAVAGVLGEPADRVEVAGRAAVEAGPALPGEPDALAVRHPCRDRHRERARAGRAVEGDRTPPAPVRLLDGEHELGLLVGARDRAVRAPAEDVAEQVLQVDVDPEPAEAERAAAARPPPPGPAAGPGPRARP